MIIIITVIITHLALVVFVVHEHVPHHSLHACPKWLCRCITAFFPPSQLLWYSCRCVYALFLWYSSVVVYLQGHTDAESLLGKHRLERGSAQKAFYQLAAWHWACTREDERWSTCARAHPHTNAHPHIYIIKPCVFLRRWIHFQTFRTLTMHSETILQNSVWNSEELFIYLLQMKEFLPKVFTLLVFLYHVFIKGSCTTTLTWKKTVWMFWWCVFLITRRCQIYKKTFSVSKVELL